MKIKQVLTAISFAALTSCGGGGDGGGGHPQFPTTQANLTLANASTFARFVDLATRAGATARFGLSMTSTSPNNFTESTCPVAGAGPVAIALSASSGPVNGTASYTNFDRCYGMRLNGTANVAGTMQPGDRFDPIDYTFTNLTFTTGNEAIQASGTAAVDWTSTLPDATYLMTLNASVSGAVSFRLENFRIDSRIVAGREEINLSGRLTTAEGFVEIAAGPTRLHLPRPSTGLEAGQITMTGATTIATVIYNGAASPTITIAPR